MEQFNDIEAVLNSTHRSEEETLGVFIAFSANLEVQRQADELQAQGKLMVPRKVFVDQKQSVLIDELLEAAYTIGKTFTEASLVLHEACKMLPEEQQKKYKEEILKGMDTLKALNQNIGVLKDRPDLRSARTIQEVLSLSLETMQWMYHVGQDCFNKEEYKKAHAVFTVLVYLNGVSPDAWVALGLTQQKIQKLSEAAVSFCLASRLEPTSISSKYNLIETYLELNLCDKAITELSELEELIKTQERDDLQPLLDYLKAAAEGKRSNL